MLLLLLLLRRRRWSGWEARELRLELSTRESSSLGLQRGSSESRRRARELGRISGRLGSETRGLRLLLRRLLLAGRELRVWLLEIRRLLLAWASVAGAAQEGIRR